MLICILLHQETVSTENTSDFNQEVSFKSESQVKHDLLEKQ